MNVTFPDNATIQIFVVPPGVAVPMISTAETPVLLDAPVRRTSRRRDALFLCVGACLCVGVLAVVQSQHGSDGIAVERAHAARLANETNPAPSAIPPARPIPQRADAIAPSGGDDPTDAVKRLLAQRPIVTPPPGAAPGVPGAAPSASASTRNAFGMSD